MKRFVTLSVLFAIATCVLGFHEEWLKFKEAYNRKYENELEEFKRMQIFKTNFEEILKHNEKYENGEVTYFQGVNQFTDKMPHELNMGCMLDINSTEFEDVDYFVPDNSVEDPPTLNWVKEGAVTPVKDQKHCGSCWAFGATGALEGLHWKKTKQLVSLSEQNLMDCSLLYLNLGCWGGLPINAFKYVKNKGIMSEASYPYEAFSIFICKYDAQKKVMSIDGYQQIEKDEKALKKAVATHGPVSVGISADLLRSYQGGVFDHAECSETKINHAVLVVGYGTDASHGDYWLVKNSWGTEWGESGYIRLARNKNMCHIADMAVVLT